ncbi:hypothetical protein DFW101_1377 [Solidesulfovibrio carbinoliphilus subsp. oakridgensis]|uniref:Spore protein YkvP/CgeB glycosyl transferase-like domain-containing protein n=1 Tax=Solidesulfovibrio carbinoliphilus subsp. oakridgensis TaxID=694327 RepID=G7Q7S7_9BACT|nr:glycosyltransferase [Solidesulfovibrio carbinoliphilus]EHJ47386.1 hypothetical protein DFW101_1377 [Solidesulfovibrio carbinoliphilus subsp. oakridgensis]
MAPRIPTVCCIHSGLGPAFERLGARVMHLSPPQGAASLPELLATLPEPPDLVLHQENLGCRLVLTDLDAAPCPTLFWALDPHLNFFWQRPYARLFSAVATTQPHLAEAFAQACPGRTAWVPWHGRARPLAPFSGRTTPLAFVGRLSRQRPRRRWFADHLARFGLTVRQDAFGEALAAVYDAARLGPNESIAGEINLRLFEAASSGCLPVSERQPEAVAELFVPDREALYYDDVLELDDRLRFALAHPGLTEKMGRAAHAAINARHLPEHRAESLWALAETATTGARGPEARAAEALTLYHLRRAGHLALPRDMVWRRLSAAPDTPEIMAARIQMGLTGGDREAVLRLAGLCLSRPELARDPVVGAACALAACRLGEVEVAKRAYVAVIGATGRRDAPRLAGERDYLLFFADTLAAAGFLAAPGMVFDPKIHLPDNAAQCLFAARDLCPGDLEIERRLEALLRRLPGTSVTRVGLLSRLTLHKPDDWSLGLELGLANLQAFRLEAGLEEIRLAGATAARQGQDARFARRLALADPAGRIRKAFAQETGTPPRTPPGE